MNSTLSSTKRKKPGVSRLASARRLLVLRRRTAPYFPFLKWGIGAAAAALVIFACFRWVFPLIKSAGALIFRPLNTLNILANPAEILKQTDGRTNILILGRAGASHEAPDLTDTIILASIRLADSQVILISIPRDTWIPAMKAKVNTAYYYGRQKNPADSGLSAEKAGFTLAKDAIFQITDLPIHYVILVDMDGLKKAIDLVGGIEIEVERSFIDEKYPREEENGDKPSTALGVTPPPEEIYETVSFEKGWRHFDGNAALKFSRSRNSADPDEGTDFARAHRQQLVLTALAKKIKSRETVFNLDRIRELQKLFDDHSDTDLSDQEILALAKFGSKVDPDQVRSLRLDEGTPEAPGLLVNPPPAQYGQWVLIPRAGDWSETYKFIKSELNK